LYSIGFIGIVEYWFSVPNAAAAPHNDLILFFKKKLQQYDANKTLAEVALKKVLGYLWYLAEELVASSLFDPIPLPTERKMIRNMNFVEGSKKRVVRYPVDNATVKQT